MTGQETWEAVETREALVAAEVTMVLCLGPAGGKWAMVTLATVILARVAMAVGVMVGEV